MVDTETTSLADGRFLLDRKLGSGGMGSVYRAFDTKKSAYVALKSLGRVDADTIRSFKAELRDFQHLSHPNLVALDELFREGESWYFTMELVVGQDLFSYVRSASNVSSLADSSTTVAVSSGAPPDTGIADSAEAAAPLPGTFDEAKFAQCLRQLASALGHLHRAGKVHCDVKSQNIIVCADGRVVLFDFGVSVDVRSAAPLRAATPLYMAPELLRTPATPSADWYAVGVLAYVAMTGVEPFTGDFAKLMESKSQLPPAPETFAADLPPALVELALELMHPDPRRRVGESRVVAYLDGFDEVTRVRRSHRPAHDEEEVFVGRSDELDLLDAMFDGVSTSGQTLIAYVKGESGIGKTALVNAFVERVKARRAGGLTVLRSRVFEEEVVPYKSVDGVVDALSEVLRSRSTAEADALLPEDFSLVADTFPVLRSVPAVAKLDRIGTPDPIERRAQMFASLKECLRRLAEWRPLVVTVDDLQWSDADGLLLWNELLRPPHAPTMLLVGTVRGERAAEDDAFAQTPAFRSGLHAVSDRVPSLPVPTEMLWLRPLGRDESQEYVRARLLMTGTSIDLRTAARWVEESNGHPLFLDQLLRSDGLSIAEGGADLEQVLRARVASLEPELRRYLEIVCVAATPLSRTLVGTAAGLTYGDGLRALKALRGERLLKTTRTPGLAGEDWVDPFHYRIRAACLGLLGKAELADRHREIAQATEAEGLAVPEQLSFHYGQAGDKEKAAHYAELAAHTAFEALGFRRAAELYAEALAQRTGPSERRLRERLAASLRNAGSGKAAAEQMLILADVDRERASEWRRQAGELLLRTGNIDLGTSVVERVLRDAGEAAPEGELHAWLLLLVRSVRVRARGTRWRPRSSSEVSLDDQQALDAMWAFSVGHGPVDQLRAYACAAAHTLRALDVGDPMRVARAFAMEALTAAAQGGSARSEEYMQAAERILGGLDDQSGLAIVPSSRALSMMMRGRWEEALAASVSAQGWIRARATGAWGELSFAEEAELWSLAMTGRLDAFVERQASVTVRAEEQRDLYASFAAKSGLANLAYLVIDRPDRALAETTTAIALWSSRGVHLQHLAHTFACAQAHLYSGNVGGARVALEKMEERRKGRRILVPEPLVPLMVDLEARIALARAFEGNKAQLAVVERAANALESTEREWTAGLSLLLRAGIDHARQKVPLAADHAFDAAQAFDRAGMSYLAVVSRRYCASLEGRAQVSAPLGDKLVRPDRFERLFIPGMAVFAADPARRSPVGDPLRAHDQP